MIRYDEEYRKMFKAFSYMKDKEYVENELISSNTLIEKALIILVLDNTNFYDSMDYTAEVILSFEANFLKKQMTLFIFTNSRLDFMNPLYSVSTADVIQGIEEDFISFTVSKQSTDLLINIRDGREDFLAKLRQGCKLLPININSNKTFYMIDELSEGLNGSIIALSLTQNEDGRYNFSIFTRSTMEMIHFICYMNSKIPNILINPHKGKRAYIFNMFVEEASVTNEYILKKVVTHVGKNMFKQINICEMLYMETVSETEMDDYQIFWNAVTYFNQNNDVLKAKITPIA